MRLKGLKSSARRNELVLTVVGLGNPGASYAKTRHNVGFMVLDGIVDGSFSGCADISLKKSGFLGSVFGTKAAFKKNRGPYMSVEANIGGNRCCFVKPSTFMNDSGKALTSLRTRGIIRELSEVLVVVDDINLEVGRTRLRSKGSAGGHNGLKSIIQHMGTDEFSRIRIGIGPKTDGMEMIRFVLGTFRPEEHPSLHTSLENASEIVVAWIEGGLQKAQNAYAKL